MNIKTLGPWVLIQRIQTPTLTKGRIHLPTEALELPNIGKVLSPGTGLLIKIKEKDKWIRKRQEPEFKEGDHVLFKKFEYKPLSHIQEDLIICHTRDLVLVITDW